MLSRIEERLFGGAPSSSQKIAHYTILERLGAGGMGTVYAAQDTRLERRVALKLLNTKLVSEHDRARLIREARVLAKLSHANVVQVFEVGEHDGDLYIAMELVDGQNLARWQRRPQGWRRVVEVYRQAAAGVVAAHAAGLLHCDLKPANILLGRGGQVKVADFGLARQEARSDTTSERVMLSEGSGSGTVRVVGTPGYIAPELWRGGEPDASSDQFALCVSLWEALADQRPYASTEELTREPRGSWVGPAWLRRVVARGLRADPNMRWPSVGALLDELEARPRRRRLSLLGLAGAGAITLIGWWGATLRPGPGPVCTRSPGLAVWTPAVARQLQAKFLASETPGTAASAAALVSEVGIHQRRWDNARRDLCAAHHVEGSVSARGFDLGQRCLERARVRAGVIRDALLDGSPPTLADGERLLDQLADPRACLDTSALRSGSGGVPGLARRWQFERELAELRVAVARGEYPRALALSSVLGASDGLEGAEALLLRGEVQAHQQGRADARASLLAAVHRASSRAPSVLHFELQLALSRLSAGQFENTLDARGWLSQAWTTWTLLGEPARLSVEYRSVEALVLEAEGELEAAHAILEQLVGELSGSDLPERALDSALWRLANVSAGLGDHARAVGIYQQLLEDRRGRLGPRHPEVGELAFNIGDSLVLSQQWERARPFLERALEIETGVYGGGSLPVSQVAVRLAEVEVELGHSARARALAATAWQTQQRELGSDHEDFGSALIILSWIYVKSESWSLAFDAYTELLSTVDLDPEGRAGLHQSLGWLLCRAQRCTEATPHLELALASEDLAVQLRASVTEAECSLSGGEAARAVDQLEVVQAELPRLEEEDRELEVELELLLGLGFAALGDNQRARQCFLNATAAKVYIPSDLREKARAWLGSERENEVQ